MSFILTDVPFHPWSSARMKIKLGDFSSSLFEKIKFETKTKEINKNIDLFNKYCFIKTLINLTIC